MRRTITEKQKKQLSAAAIVIFVLFSLGVMWFVGRPMLRFVSDPERFRLWVNGHGLGGRLAFIGMVVLQIVVAIIPGEPLEIGAGYAFGPWEGTALCIIGNVIGSLIVFLFVRRFGVKLVEVFFSREKIESLAFLKNTKKLNALVFLIYFIPGTPKDILGYFIGLTPMKLSHWLLIAAVARIPSVITSTLGGDALLLQDYRGAAVILVLTLFISAIGLILYRTLSNSHKEKEQNGEH